MAVWQDEGRWQIAFWEAIVLLACVKLLNANDALKGDVVSFLKEIQDA